MSGGYWTGERILIWGSLIGLGVAAIVGIVKDCYSNKGPQQLPAITRPYQTPATHPTQPATRPSKKGLDTGLNR